MNLDINDLYQGSTVRFDGALERTVNRISADVVIFEDGHVLKEGDPFWSIASIAKPPFKPVFGWHPVSEEPDSRAQALLTDDGENGRDLIGYVPDAYETWQQFALAHSIVRWSYVE